MNQPLKTNFLFAGPVRQVPLALLGHWQGSRRGSQHSRPHVRLSTVSVK